MKVFVHIQGVYHRTRPVRLRARAAQHCHTAISPFRHAPLDAPSVRLMHGQRSDFSMSHANYSLPPIVSLDARFDLRGAQPALDSALDETPDSGHKQIPNRGYNQQFRNSEEWSANRERRIEQFV